MNVTIEVMEPLESGKVVFAAIGPPQIGAAKQGRVSIWMRVTNNETTAVKVSKIEIMGQIVSQFPAPVEIAPGAVLNFHNHQAQNHSVPLIISAPYPLTAKIAVYLVGQASPVEKVVSIAPHTNDGGPLLFVGKANDLRQNEAWGASSQHVSGHQVFALDMGVLGWTQNSWSDKFPDADWRLKESYRIYGMPVYAMADDTVCWALNDHEERARTTDSADTTTSPSMGKFVGGGNQIFVKTGDEVSVYAHLQRGSIPSELMTAGAAVRKGQYLGKVGLSGSSSHPHIHIHTKKLHPNGAPLTNLDKDRMNNCDAGEFRPMTFKDIQSLTEAEANTLGNQDALNSGSWTPLTNHSAPHPYALLYPSTAPYSFSKNATDSRQYIGVWRESPEIELRVKASGWSNFVKKWEELSGDTFRIVRLETFVENNQRQFLGIFKRGNWAHYLWNVSDWNGFISKWTELSKAGLRLIDFTTYTEGNTRFYVGIYQSGSDRHALWSITGWDAFVAKWDEFAKAGLRLIDLETHPVGNTQQYIGVFREGNYAYTLWSITGWSAFTAKWDEFSRNSLRLMDIETFAVGNRRQFIGVFRQGSGGYALESVTGYHRFIQSCEKWNSANLRLVDVHVEQ